MKNIYIRIALSTLLAFLAAIVLWRIWNYYINDPWTRDGRIRAEIIQITPDVSGLVTTLSVQDNQLVKKDDILFEVDRARYELALRQAQANLASKDENLKMAKREMERSESLSRNNAVAKSDTETRETETAVAQAQYDQAKADLDTAQLNMERLSIRAPVDGYVTNLNFRAGNYVHAGTPVFALVDANSYYVTGYFEENKLQHIRPGMTAIIHVMGMTPELKGRVESIASGIVDRERNDGTNLLANVNPTFSWVRLAQRVPVRIALEDVPDDIKLVAGQTVTVEIAK